MNALKAHVENGRIVVEGSVDLPDGTALELDLRVVDDEDELDETERARLHEALDRAIDSARAGRTVDADQAIRRVLSRS
ncbi:MAG TPA: hypothetical protein VHC69_05985 [Polyangiaceae bacterium]|nr:hypothetical protein [Polyangiaceae bacterium]